MKALILNSGKGSRMGDLTKTHPKCMTEIASMETIISRGSGAGDFRGNHYHRPL